MLWDKLRRNGFAEISAQEHWLDRKIAVAVDQPKSIISDHLYVRNAKTRHAAFLPEESDHR
jgi:hypothetical protein